MLNVNQPFHVIFLTFTISLQISMLADFDQITSIKVAKEKDNMQKVEIAVVSGDNQDEATLNFGLLKDDAMNFVGMVEGYYRIFVDGNRNLVEKPASRQSADPDGRWCVVIVCVVILLINLKRGELLGIVRWKLFMPRPGGI